MQNISSIPKARSRKEKRDFCLAHVGAWKVSSKSQSQYCNEHGLKLSTFGYWRTLDTQKKQHPGVYSLSIKELGLKRILGEIEKYFTDCSTKSA